jgi:prepilin-type N-terminal cleavage/methylation domain-containing protein
MNRINSHIEATIDSTTERPTKRRAGRPEAGFTLIELLTAVAIIAILIGLLLPVIQQKREDFASDRANDNLTLLLQASQEYFARTGQYPDDLADLRILSGTPTANGTFQVIVTTGRAEGYLYDVDALGDADGDGDVDGNDFLVLAEPEFPGITGAVSLSIDRNGARTSNPTPGADAAREQMFDNIRAKAAETVVNLLRLDDNALTQIRSHTEAPGTAGELFNRLDGNHDGRVSITEVRFADTTFDDNALMNPLQGFLNFVAREMKWDSLSPEASQTIAAEMAIVFDDGTGPWKSFFSYDGLCDLTGTLLDSNDPVILDELCGRLNEAEAAETSGNQNGKAKALKNFQKAVKRLIGQSLTRNEANILITLSRTL